MAKKKAWYQSKSKVGALVGGLGMVLASAAPAIQQDNGAAWVAAAPNIISAIGGVLAVFGFRDALGGP